jgi:UDP-2-acetamido-3-amino-2,3-dideoxy-glucuronate N-acetyltransferase
MSDYFVHETAIIDDGAKIGDGTKIWHWAHICGKADIGNDCVFGQNVFVANRVKIGHKVKVQNNVSIYDDVVLEDDVFCGPSMVFTNVYNPRAHIERKDEYRQTLIKQGATLGANCTIICGNTIGQYAMIGAAAVITKDVKPHALMVGVPAKQMGWVSHAGEILDDDLICPRQKRRYEIKDNNLKEII